MAAHRDPLRSVGLTWRWMGLQLASRATTTTRYTREASLIQKHWKKELQEDRQSRLEANRGEKTAAVVKAALLQSHCLNLRGEFLKLFENVYPSASAQDNSGNKATIDSLEGCMRERSQLKKSRQHEL